MKKMHFFQAVLLICTMAIIHQARGQTGDPTFVRWVDTGEQMGHLDTSIQSYRHPAGRRSTWSQPFMSQMLLITAF